MTKEEKRILKEVVEHHAGILSPVDLINGIARGAARPVNNLVSRGYLEELPEQRARINGDPYTINFYRATDKGLSVFDAWYTKVWSWLSGDVRTIVVSAITALITALIALIVGRIWQ